jgi:N utilization substance protein B
MYATFASICTSYPVSETFSLLRTMSKAYNALDEFARELCDLIDKHRAELERDLEGIVENWRLDRIGFVERAILLLGTAEIAYLPDIPPRVTINEYIEIAKLFCADDAPRFINGVLDKVAKVKQKKDFFVRSLHPKS